MAARLGEEIRFRARQHDVPAYRAVPTSGHGAGIVVVHDEWGLNEFARDVCDRLARAQFVAVAPDLLAGERAIQPDEAEQLAKGLDATRAATILDRTVVELLSHDSTTGRTVGALGFGTGGALAFALAGRGERLGGTVGFYADPTRQSVELGAIQSPVLAIFAGDDASIDAQSVRRMEDELRAAGVRHSVQTRDGVAAGFMNDSRPDVHDSVAAFESWDTVLAFFRAELS